MKKMPKIPFELIFLVAIAGMVIIAVIGLFITPIPKTPEQFTYNHHDYIRFCNGSIVHNPECKTCIQAFD